MYDQPLTQDPDQNEIQQEQIRRGVFRAQTKKFRWTRLWGGKLVLIEDFYCFLLISDHCWCCISQWFLGTHGKWKLCWIMLASGNYAKLCYMMLARLQSVNYAFYAKASVAQPKRTWMGELTGGWLASSYSSRWIIIKSLRINASLRTMNSGWEFHTLKTLETSRMYYIM